MANEERPHLHVEFFAEPVENKRKTREEGRPIFEDKEFIRIRFAGDRTRVHVAPATEVTQRDLEGNGLTYIQRFPKHYEAFKENREFIGEGMPLSELPFLTESKRAELKAVNIHTAEALADLEGARLASLGMGGRALKDQAASWISAAEGSAATGKLAQDNEELRARIALLEGQMAENGKAQGAAPAAPPPTDDGPFADFSDDDLKAYIKDQSGRAPTGTPKRETLLNMAQECADRLKSQAA